MMETTDSRRLDNGNRNEPVPGVWIMEMERRTKLRPRLWEKDSGRLDEMNRFRTFEIRNEPVLDVWIMEIETNRNDTKRFFLLIFVDSGRLDNELRNEPVPDVKIHHNFPQFVLRLHNIAEKFT
ncbi:unnamed protein product [Rhizophagus irregularis]|nr:unnamed protein product [Rhizophagus irregularis]